MVKYGLYLTMYNLYLTVFVWKVWLNSNEHACVAVLGGQVGSELGQVWVVLDHVQVGACSVCCLCGLLHLKGKRPNYEDGRVRSVNRLVIVENGRVLDICAVKTGKQLIRMDLYITFVISKSN